MTSIRNPLRASLRCSHCGQHTTIQSGETSFLLPAAQMSAAFQGITVGTGTEFFVHLDMQRWWIGICNACRGVMLVCNDGDVVYPAPQPDQVHPQIPEPMRSDLEEAKRCQTVGAWNATVVMARRALQCSAVEQGAPTGQGWPLWKQIAWLDDNRKITPAQRQFADAARWVGNHGAHDTEPNVGAGQPAITEVTRKDAANTIQLVEHLFDTLYVGPRLAQAQLDKRGKSGGGPKR